MGNDKIDLKHPTDTGFRKDRKNSAATERRYGTGRCWDCGRPPVYGDMRCRDCA